MARSQRARPIARGDQVYHQNDNPENSGTVVSIFYRDDGITLVRIRYGNRGFSTYPLSHIIRKVRRYV